MSIQILPRNSFNFLRSMLTQPVDCKPLKYPGWVESGFEAEPRRFLLSTYFGISPSKNQFATI